ncbi:MAG: hypothetical protein A2119_01635 [Candidatus Colwellbacteria bacterium GWA2_46_10]|uniref:Type 4 fimbrial biogenesis protein PilX N-terminal domain-containing protein n=2 Tax=Parcubacteria group TaxID=1794811 RepID=A0A1G1YW11_9BACT|nr:MAG: hypothetical protein A2119_01635 [Candidatus Colwellbacteria bacterium GWA2_46_10]
MKRSAEKGQLMLLSVLLISSAVLGAATIAGLLVLFQLRQTADAEASAQAVFASDAGVERALYEKYRNGYCGDANSQISSVEDPQDIFTIADDVQYKVLLEEECTLAKSAGLSGRSARAFILYFGGIENFGGQFVE